MAKLGKKFDTDGREEMGNFDALPVGSYVVKVKKSDERRTKAYKEAKERGEKIRGKSINFQFEVTEGEHKGRLIFTNLNTENESAQTEKIADQEMTSIVKACGKRSIEDTDELNGCEMLVTVKIEKGNAQWPDKNKITKYDSPKGVARPSAGKGEKKKKKKKKKVQF